MKTKNYIWVYHAFKTWRPQLHRLLTFEKSCLYYFRTNKRATSSFKQLRNTKTSKALWKKSMGCRLTATGVQLGFYKYHCEKKEGFSLMYTNPSVTHFSAIKYNLVLEHQMLLQQVLSENCSASKHTNQSFYYNIGSFCKSQGITHRDG